MNRRTSAWVCTHAPAGTRWGRRTLSLLLSLVLCLTLLPGAALAEEAQAGAAGLAPENGAAVQAEAHTHHLCGGDNRCTVPSHTDGNHESDVVFDQQLTTQNGVLHIDGTAQTVDLGHYSLPKGNYYLAEDISLDSQLCIKSGETVNLCLNGKTITGNGDFDVIYVSGGGCLNLTDCVGSGRVTHAADKTGRGVYIGTDSGFNLYGGEISGNTGNTSARNGGGVFVTYNYNGISAAFHMYGGKISRNTARGDGGGVYVDGYTDSSGNHYAAFTMCGGEITGNTSEGNGGGVYNNGTFTVSGPAKITGNTSSTGAANNVYLPASEKKITIGGTLDQNARIDVTLGDSYGDASFLSDWSENMDQNANPANYFHSDKDGYTVGFDNGETKLTAHSHTYGGWSTDGINHWHECTDASCPNKTGSITDQAAHVYDDAADTTCNVCGYVRWIYSGSSTPSYSVTAPSKTDNGAVSLSTKRAKKSDTVTITVTPDEGYTLETLTATDKDGNELKLTDKGDGKYTFTMPSGSVTVTATFMDDNTMLNFFMDVKASDYFYDAVLWAAKKGITSGISATEFGPNQPCTRAQIITFLWRAAGSPVVNYAMNMTDVPEDAYYAEAVRWALSEGITTGTTATTFSPNSECTRAQAVTFLYRALNAKASGKAAFSDVPTGSYYADAVAWAVENGVTTGIADTLFGPDNSCTRAQIVTFLWRAYSK